MTRHSPQVRSFTRANGLRVEHWTGRPIELESSQPDPLRVCIHLRPADVSIWSGGRCVVDGMLPSGAMQIHLPGDAPWFVARDRFELIRFIVPQSVFDSVVGWMGRDSRAAPVHLVDRGIVIDPFLLAAGRELRSALHGDSASMRVHAEALATSVLTHLLAFHSDVATTERTAADRDPKLRRAFELIEERVSGGVSIGELSAVTGLSTSSLTRRFKQCTGFSPHGWLIERRIVLAARLLLETGRHCADIAAECGFASAQHFSVAFKKSRGLTPSEFRAQARGS